MGNFFSVISGKYLYLKLLENAKRTVIYFWYKGFVHLKLRLLDFLSDFVLNLKHCDHVSIYKR